MPNTFDPLNIEKPICLANTSSTSYRQNFMAINVANLIGGGAGAAVTTAVTFDPALPSNAQNISVLSVVPDQDATFSVDQTTITTTGFNLVLRPRLAANTLAVGNNQVFISWEE